MFLERRPAETRKPLQQRLDAAFAVEFRRTQIIQAKTELLVLGTDPPRRARLLAGSQHRGELGPWWRQRRQRQRQVALRLGEMRHRGGRLAGGVVQHAERALVLPLLFAVARGLRQSVERGARGVEFAAPRLRACQHEPRVDLARVEREREAGMFGCLVELA